MLVERPIDFFRHRHMLCGRCGHRLIVDLDWIDRWEQSQERCPECGVDCEEEASPRVTVPPNDPALDTDAISRYAWYHTSTQPNWPTRDFDPIATLTNKMRCRMERMCGEGAVARWAERQRSKALHIGTYEAAVHNMLRRIRHQSDFGQQFYLYRVCLKPTITVREDWITDPGGLVGDVALEDVCPPGVDVTRYLNYHEDAGSLSLALGRDAIASTQQISIPVHNAHHAGWVAHRVSELEAASNIPPLNEIDEDDPLCGLAPPSSPRVLKASKIADQLACRLPINLRHKFEAALAIQEGGDYEAWARYAINMVDLIDDPIGVLTQLDTQEIRLV